MNNHWQIPQADVTNNSDKALSFACLLQRRFGSKQAEDCYVGVQSKKKGAFSAFNSKESSDNLPIEPAYEFLETSSWHKSDEKKKILSDSTISCKEKEA